jgi:pimeloyl-ACP methyl ester carboxylesterase
LQKWQNSKAGKALDKILFRIWYLCWNLTNIVHWSEIPSGGHFAALEQPDLMLADLRAFISTVAGEQH